MAIEFKKKPVAAAPKPATVVPTKQKDKQDKKHYEDKPKRADDFPIVSAFNKSDMKESIRLMQESVRLSRLQKECKESLDTIKVELAGIAKRNKVEGMRYGSLVVYYRGEKTRKTLNYAKLLEAGVPASKLDQGYVESKPFLDLQVRDLEAKEQTDSE